MMAKTSIDTTKKSLHSAANVHSEELTNLIQQTESSEEKPVEFRGIHLSDVKTGVAFVQTQKVNFASRITTALQNRLKNLLSDTILQAVQMLDINCGHRMTHLMTLETIMSKCCRLQPLFRII